MCLQPALSLPPSLSSPPHYPPCLPQIDLGPNASISRLWPSLPRPANPLVYPDLQAKNPHQALVALWYHYVAPREGTDTTSSNSGGGDGGSGGGVRVGVGGSVSGSNLPFPPVSYFRMGGGDGSRVLSSDAMQRKKKRNMLMQQQLMRTLATSSTTTSTRVADGVKKREEEKKNTKERDEETEGVLNHGGVWIYDTDFPPKATAYIAIPFASQRIVLPTTIPTMTTSAPPPPPPLASASLAAAPAPFPLPPNAPELARGNSHWLREHLTAHVRATKGSLPLPSQYPQVLLPQALRQQRSSSSTNVSGHLRHAPSSTSSPSALSLQSTFAEGATADVDSLCMNESYSLAELEALSRNYSTFVYDPRDPCPAIGGNVFPHVTGPGDGDEGGGIGVDKGGKDYRSVLLAGGYNQVHPRGHFLSLLGTHREDMPLASRRDVLTFASQPLAEEVEVTGSVHALLFVSSDCCDTDFTIKVVDEYPPSKGMIIDLCSIIHSLFTVCCAMACVNFTATSSFTSSVSFTSPSHVYVAT